VEAQWEDGERVFRRTWRQDVGGERQEVIIAVPAATHPTPGTINRLTHEYELREYLDGAWAVRPLELVRERGQTMLVLEAPRGEPLERLISGPMDIERFLRLAIALSVTLGKLHERGLIHRDVKPANILVDAAAGRAWLTGFGIASRLARERQPPAPPDLVAGTLPYMAPEQTGRMNRSTDSRSDLYSLGVTLYQMLTGSLPFTASEPMEWVHCHIARLPTPPNERSQDIPGPVSALVMKLLAKTVEERYQTAAGVEHDLRRCSNEWRAQGWIGEFPLGEQDIPDRLLLPEKLYGRAREIEALLSSFDRVVASGKAELVLVYGYSGIGKSSIVNELHKILVLPRGLFASGKFDQYKRDIPYATLAQALQSLIRPLLGKPEAELSPWREALLEALGPNGPLMIDLVPELKFIIGELQGVPDLPPQDAKARFQLVFRRFIGVFARPEHPLALFLDDLQWLDAATLDLLQDLLTQADVRNLLLIGAYRSNEVSPSHPLMVRLEAIRRSGASMREVVVAPLASADLTQLVADRLYCGPERAAPLVELIHEKTGGNPFFAIQFLSALAEESLLSFNREERRWRWNLDRIRAKGYTDNVVELMIGRLNRLPGAAQSALQNLACIGSGADVARLCLVCGKPEDDVHADLSEAVRLGLVIPTEGAYGFAHDRVQEAAYSLIPEDLRAQTHLRTGKLLLERTSPDKREEAIFEIVNQLDRGAPLVASRDEREQMAELNLLAGKRAKASAAYTSALKYFVGGREFLLEDRWDRNYALTFALTLGQADCEYLSGNTSAAKEHLDILSRQARNLIDRAAVACVQIDLYTNSDQADEAITVALEFFERAGFSWSRHPGDADVALEFERIWRQLGGRPIEQLVELPVMTDPVLAAILDVLTAAHAPANFTGENLLALIIARMVNISIEHGNGNGSPLAYVFLGMILESRFANYDAGFRFGKTGVDLVERSGLDRFRSYAYLNFGNAINPWSRPVRSSLALLLAALNAAQEAGHLTAAAYTHSQLIAAKLFSGDALDEVQYSADSGLAFTRQIHFGTGIELVQAHLGFVRALRGLTPNLTSFEEPFEAGAGSAMSTCWYWIRKLQACVLVGDYAAALNACARASSLLWTSPGFLVLADFHFYAALALAAANASSSPEERSAAQLERLKSHQRQMQIWAGTCAENFENRSLLIAAEVARIEGRDLEAMHLYESAIQRARQHGFIQNEALAAELAASFYAARGFDRTARTYFKDARNCYLRWGADAKVKQLDRLYPDLGDGQPRGQPVNTIQARVELLDLATVIKVSQAISGEIVLEKLIDTIMRTAIEHAGAERGVLILPGGGDYRVEAEATTRDAVARVDKVMVDMRSDPVEVTDLPVSVFHYVLRTKETVLLHDASAEQPFSDDIYVLRRRARSVLCLPLLKQTRLLGVLYLENNLTPRAFTPDRMTILQLVASQAAISLENTRLYRDLQEREAKVRRLVESNIVGIFIWDVEGRISDANDAFLETVGYDRNDLASGALRWTELTPEELRGADGQHLLEMKANGSVQPYEKVYLKKDGSRVPVLVGRALLDETGEQGVAFVVDLTDRKQAEEAVRESERRYHEIQIELAHVNRVVTIGQLSASIAHEVNQPLSGIVTNASTCLRMLTADSPNVAGALQTARRMIRDANRASDIIARLRALFTKKETPTELVDLNEAVREVISLSLRELQSQGVSVRSELVDHLPAVKGDRIQLQQVLLNLIRNGVDAMGAIVDGPRQLAVRTALAQPDGVLIAVQDTGPGIAQENLARIFDAFYTTKPGGLGMGLSICQTIIEAHGGRLWAETAGSRGALFQLTLPAAAVAMAVSSESTDFSRSA
jgi:PAS domain S-box-containing protein